MLGQLSVFTAGLWGVAWPIIAGSGIVAGLLVLAYFSPLGKRYFVEAAIVVAMASKALWTRGF